MAGRAIHTGVRRVIEARAEALEPWERLYGRGGRLCVTDCAHGAFGIGELLRVATRAGCVAGPRGAVPAILSAVALPIYISYAHDAKVRACRDALGTIRAAVQNYYSRSASFGGPAVWPALDDLATRGTVMESAIPANPFDPDAEPNDITVAPATVKGTLRGSGGGWCYDPATGAVWANTNTAGVGENGF